MPRTGLELMKTPDYWPFTRQADYDAFNANMKSDNHQWKEQAIRAWIEARYKQPKEGESTDADKNS